MKSHIFAISDDYLKILYNTYKLKVSLYFGDQLWALVLVICLRRLPERWGPIKFISTNGLNACVLGHFKSLAATTSLINGKIISLRFDIIIYFIPMRFCCHVYLWLLLYVPLFRDVYRDQPGLKPLRRFLLEIEKYLKLRNLLEYVVKWWYWIICMRDIFNIYLDITLMCLALNEILNKCIGGLCIQRQGVLQRFQVLAFVDVAHFQTDASSMEVLFYHFKRVL